MTIALASNAQLSYLRSLLITRVEDETESKRFVEWLDNNSHRVDKVTASAKIRKYAVMPEVRKVGSFDTANDIEIGMYTVDGVIYKVQRAVHGSGNLYAKRWDAETESFDIERGAIRKIYAEHRMSADEAGAFGLIIGACAHCGKTLTDEESIARGLGPICAGKYA